MSIAKDLGIVAGMVLILTGMVFAVGTSSLPGIGTFDNPIDSIDSSTEESSSYDVSTQVRVGSTALGETEISGFTYQTQNSCNFCLSISEGGSLSSIGGSSNVKADVRVVNQDTGKVYVQTTKFIDDIGAGQNKEVEVSFDNAPAGEYLVRYIVTYDPSVFDLTDQDNVKRARYNIEVPKVSGQ